jgi:hypothetical protein
LSAACQWSFKKGTEREYSSDMAISSVEKQMLAELAQALSELTRLDEELTLRAGINSGR